MVRFLTKTLMKLKIKKIVKQNNSFQLLKYYRIMVKYKKLLKNIQQAIKFALMINKLNDL
jgi:elongation factor P--beta-lysine ligase